MTGKSEFMDRKMLADETGFARSTIDWIFRQVNVVAFPGHRKVYVRRADVVRLIDEGTFTKDRVRA